MPADRPRWKKLDDQPNKNQKESEERSLSERSSDSGKDRTLTTARGAAKIDAKPYGRGPDIIGVPEAKAVGSESECLGVRDGKAHHGKIFGADNHVYQADTPGLLRPSMDIKYAGVRSNVQAYFEEAKETRSLPVLEPNGLFMRCWRPLIFSLVVLAVIMVPFELSYSWWSPPIVYKVCMYLVDILFMGDMVIHFNTAFVHDDHVVRDRKEIAKHYATSWLVPDCLSNFPFDWFLSSSGKNRKILKFFKLPKIFRFVRMLRSLKEQLHYVGVGGVVAAIVLFAHICACIWTYGMVSDCEDLDDACPDVEGTYLEGITVSMATITGTDAWRRWISPTGSARMSKMRSAYEQLMGAEELFASVIMVIGYVLLACLFGTVAAAIQHMNDRGRRRALQLQSRKQDMRQARVPLNLQHRVEATYEHAWMFGDWHDGLFTDETLSLDLRRNLALHVYGPALKAVPMFKKFPDHDLKCLAQKIVSKCYTPGDLIIQVGERACEIFFIFTGSARPVDKQGNEMQNVLLKKGDFFGEICFLSPGSRRTASVVCVAFCRAMVLTLQVFEELGLEALLDSLREECIDHMNHYKTATRHQALASGDPTDEAPVGVRKSADDVAQRLSSRVLPTDTGPGESGKQKVKKWGKNARKQTTTSEPIPSSASANGPSGDAANNWIKASKDIQLTSIIRMIHELVEVVDRNAAEVMNRIDSVERRQEQLFDMIGKSDGAGKTKSLGKKFGGKYRD